MELINKIARKSRYLFNDLLFSIGFKKNDPTTYRQKAMMLVYHGIDQKGSTAFNSRFISQPYFNKQIRYFKKHFNIVTLDQYYHQDFVEDKLNICITFDDGYANNYHYALPILEKHNVPAAFYITTIRTTEYDHLWADYIDMASSNYHKPITIGEELFRKGKHNEYYSITTGLSLKNTCKQRGFQWKEACMDALPDDFKNNTLLNDYWRLMDEEQIKALNKSPLVTIGSHGNLHNCLGVIDYESACQDVKTSKEYLERLLEHPVKSIAYPDGSYSKEIVEYCDQIGFNRQLVVDFIFEEDRSDPRLKARFGINPYISWNNQLECILKGRYH